MELFKIWGKVLRHPVKTSQELILYKDAVAFAAINFLVGGFLYAWIVFGIGSAFGGAFLALVPGLISLAVTAFLTHICFKLFSDNGFEATFSVYALASISALFAWLPILYFVGIIFALTIIIAGLSHHHESEWWKTILVLIMVAIITSLLYLLLGVLFGGAA